MYSLFLQLIFKTLNRYFIFTFLNIVYIITIITFNINIVTFSISVHFTLLNEVNYSSAASSNILNI